ncbi:ABC transporter permease [Nocardioides sp. cx-169]|uniref:ABC transporter permease n=1 Tax=Nocardioides sp. cx-169 TaxID=2899080 RepID=UPI001E64E6F2|nr:ABC transporter permease [Nocardioides sp. cx-169]MCD4536595.1 ABC transporter permease [Nocardioides sp. cx-169]
MTEGQLGAVANQSPEVAAAGMGRTKRVNRPLLWVAVAWLGAVGLLALLAPFLPIASYVTPVGPPRMAPFNDWPEFLGTDSQGRSVLSRLIYGGRDTLAISLGASLIGFVVGSIIGIVMGYFRGVVDRVVGFGVDVFLAFPPLVVLLLLVTALRPSVPTLLVTLGLLVTPSFARLSRGSTLVWVDRPFVIAARTYGASNWRIITRDLTGNVILPLLTILPIVIAVIMIAEGSLSFLGFGMPPPRPSWGNMISAGTKELRITPVLTFIPAIVLFFTIFFLNVIGERVRSRFEMAGDS